MPTPQNLVPSHHIMLGEEEMSDVSLGTFYVFDKEHGGTLDPNIQLAAGGCGCGHGGGGCGHGCGGCGHGCGGCGHGCGGFGCGHGCRGCGFGCRGCGCGFGGCGGCWGWGWGWGGCCLSWGGCALCWRASGAAHADSRAAPGRFGPAALPAARTWCAGRATPMRAQSRRHSRPPTWSRHPGVRA